MTPTEDALAHYPWEPRPIHKEDPLHEAILTHLRYMATGGRGMTRSELDLAQWLYDETGEDFVVNYTEETGFFLTDRQKGDGRLVVRRQEHFTPRHWVLLRKPPRQPNEATQ